jgi:hypothetical protein
MASMTALGRSILESEVLRSIQDAENHWARANRKLVDGDQPELPKLFFTRDEMNLVLARHEQELAASQPPPTTSAWESWKADGRPTSKRNGSSFEPFASALMRARGDGAPSSVSLAATIDMIEAALADDRLTLPMLREALGPVIRLCRRPPPSDAALRHIESWLSATVAAWSASPALDELAIDDDEDGELADVGPPEASPKPAKVVAAIEDGVVVPIGRKGRSDAH